MRNHNKRLLGASLATMLLSTAVFAIYEPAPEERGQILSGDLRTRLEYDDNVWTTENYPVATTHLSLDYRLGFIWYDDRPQDDSDLNHDLDIDISSEFSPRTRANLTNIFRYGQDPELDPNDVAKTRNEDFAYNSTNLGVRQALTETLDMGLAGRYFLYRYDEEVVADVLDRDTFVLGVDLRKEINPTSDGLIAYRYQDVDYTTTLKDSQSHYLLVGIDHQFNSRLMTHLVVGYENRKFDTIDEVKDDDNAPYVDLNAVYNLSEKTMITGGYRFSMSDTDLSAFLISQRHGLYAHFTQTLTDRLFLRLAAQYDLNDYDEGDSPVAASGDEAFWRFSARLAYQITEIVSAEAGYMFNDLASDYQRDYTRNRVYLGLRFTY